MQDRIPTPGQEGRVLITPEGGSPYYAKIEMADNPIQEGTPFNKSNTLKDYTAIALGLTPDAVVNDAFMALAIGADKYGIEVHVQLPNGLHVPNAKITGLLDIYGGELFTDLNGDALGVSDTSTGSFNVSSPYIDIGDKSVDFNLAEKITNISVTLDQLEDKEKSISQSKTGILFSSYVTTFDVCAVGGGGGGGGENQQYGGAGGGGGYVENLTGIQRIEDTPLDIVIGAGGSHAKANSSTSSYVPNGGDGGTTTVTYGSVSISANGGSGGQGGSGGSTTGNYGPAYGGSGNGNGGNGHRDWNQSSNGGKASSTAYKFGESSLGIAGGGGGGGGWGYPQGNVTEPRSGGNPNGGAGGGNSDSVADFAAEDGAVPGGGGGGGGPVQAGEYSGSGGAGIVYVRWHTGG